MKEPYKVVLVSTCILMVSAVLPRQYPYCAIQLILGLCSPIHAVCLVYRWDLKVLSLGASVAKNNIIISMTKLNL